MQLHFDFSAILFIGAVITGLIWLIDARYFAKKRLANIGEDTEPKLVEYSRSFFPVLLIVFILRAFIAEPYRIPSGSMKPTLLVGDFILVNKFSYDLKLPLLSKTFANLGEPKRGDVIVFRHPLDQDTNLIKRVVATSGDTVRYENKMYYINGSPIEQEFIAMEHDDEGPVSFKVRHLNEKLDKEHSIYLTPAKKDRMIKEWVVPEGHYFVSGDNRDNSSDSRSWDFVSKDLILGKAQWIWLSWNHQDKDVRWSRFGTKI